MRTIAINQQSYIEGMLEKLSLTSAKPISMPMDSGTKFLNEQCPSTLMQLVKMHGVPYTEAIGSMLWPVMILRLCLCCIDPSAIRPEPHASTLGGCKKSHGISGNHACVMAHLWWQTNC